MVYSEFIEKLIDILEHSKFVVWNEDGTEFEIIDIKNFTEITLRDTFRHTRMDSFTRQLNMYGFHKVNRRKCSVNFYHCWFHRDHPEKYHLIQRAKVSKKENRGRTMVNPSFEMVSERLGNQSPNFSELIFKLIEFSTSNEFDHRQMKKQFDNLWRLIPQKKERILRPTILLIKEKLAYLEEIQKRIAKVDLKELSSFGDSPAKSNSNDTTTFLSTKTIKCVSAPEMVSTESRPELQIQFQSVKSISNFLAIG